MAMAGHGTHDIGGTVFFGGGRGLMFPSTVFP